MRGELMSTRGMGTRDSILSKAVPFLFVIILR